MNHYLLITFDSCRYDSWAAARPRVMARLGPVERRYSYASWTAPSHYNLLMGLMPHHSPKHVNASQYYGRELLKFNERLDARGTIQFKSFVPKLYLPSFLSGRLGYHTHARVSLPVLNPHTILNTGFESYKLMETHNDLRAMIRELTFPDDRPSFYFLNVGETHYPYALPHEPPNTWPRLRGVHGVLEHLDDVVTGDAGAGEDDEDAEAEDERPQPFDEARLALLRERQVEAVRYLDGVMEELFDVVPSNTYITITADHGELFGEDGYFGHGPIQHPKVLEVPFVEGKLR